MEQKKVFSPEKLYQEGLSDMTNVSHLQDFLLFYAQYANSLEKENTILLWKQKTALPEEYHTLEEWNTQNRKVIYGETSHLRLYAPENYSGKMEEYNGRSMIALFHEKQTVQSDKYHRNTAEHPFSFVGRNAPEPTDEVLLQSCVGTALSCMQTMRCGMPVFEESSEYVTLSEPVRYDLTGNHLYIAKGASYDDVAYGLLRETLFCKLYQPNQTYQIYEMHRFQASCAAQVILHQMGVTKSFPLSMPSNAVSAQEIEQCIASIPSGIETMRQDYAWIQSRLKEEQAAQVSAPSKNKAQTISDGNIKHQEAEKEVPKKETVADEIRKDSPAASNSWDEALDFQDLQHVSTAGRQRADAIGI